MRATQCHISTSLAGLDFASKYNLTSYVDTESPLVIFGMYNEQDLNIYLNHPAPVILVWQGCDARDVAMNNEWSSAIKMRSARHYSISHWIDEHLQSVNIPYQHLPISATSNIVAPKEPGTHIYFYTSDLSDTSMEYYGMPLALEVRRMTGLPMIIAHLNKFTKSELQSAYLSSFINLRLTTMDGCPNTNLEMGLMGRPSIFNGVIPTSIAWDSIDDICESVVDYYNKRTMDQAVYISKKIHNYLNINDQWLTI